jgi:ABC-type Na+ efflux pump permease subunit
MSIFKHIREIKRNKRLFDEKVYEMVLEKIAQDQKQPGLWAKAIADSSGNMDKAKSLYIKYRAEAIKQDINFLKDNELKTEKQENSPKAQEKQEVKSENSSQTATSKPEEDVSVFTIIFLLALPILIFVVIFFLLKLFAGK